MCFFDEFICFEYIRFVHARIFPAAEERRRHEVGVHWVAPTHRALGKIWSSMHEVTV